MPPNACGVPMVAIAANIMIAVSLLILFIVVSPSIIGG
jgi:hypothetical protein